MASSFVASPNERTLHPSLPLSTDPSPRISAFIRSQQEHLPFYKQEGIALFEDWLREQKQRTPASGSASGSKAKGKEREERARPAGKEGIRAVDVLGGMGSGSAAAVKSAGEGVSSGESGKRVRMADRMRGKDGGAGGGTKSTSTKDKNKLPPQPSSIFKERRDTHHEDKEDDDELPEGSDIVLTRKEIKRRESTSTSANPPFVVDPPRPHYSDDHRTREKIKKRPRLELVDENANDQNQSQHDSPPPTSHRPPKPATSTFKPDFKASSSEPNKSAFKPNPSPSSKQPSGKENDLAVDDDEHAVRLEERKLRRREKAAIVNPKPRSPSSAASSLAREEKDSASTDAGSSRKTGRVVKKKTKLRSKSRRAEEEFHDDLKDEEGSRKRRKKEKSRTDGGGKDTKKKKENRDLGVSLGMGLGIMDTFKAGNLRGGSSRRLTLKRDVPKPGVFNKGRASSKVSAKGKRGEAVGVQDLVFNESRFLSHPRATKNSSTFSASIEPEPRSQPHRSSRTRQNSTPPSATSKKRKHRVVEDSDEAEWEEDENGDQPVETVSRFFAASKPKAGHSTGKEKEKVEPPKKRVEYSPSWPDIVEEEEHDGSRRASEQESRPSTARQGRTRSLSLQHLPSDLPGVSSEAASVARSGPSRLHRSSSQPNPASSSRPRSTAIPTRFPARRPRPPHQPVADLVDVLLRACETGRLPSPAHDDRPRRREKLVYDGDSSVGDYEVFVEIPVDGQGNEGTWDVEAGAWREENETEEQDLYSRPFQPSRFDDGPFRDQGVYGATNEHLSDLGSEADVFRTAGHDFRAHPHTSSSRRPRFSTRFDVKENIGYPQQQQSQESFQEMDVGWISERDHEDDDGSPLHNFDNDARYSPPPITRRNRARFQPPPSEPAPLALLDNEAFYSDDEQPAYRPHLLSHIPDADEEDDEDMIVMEAEQLAGLDLKGHWRRHRT